VADPFETLGIAPSFVLDLPAVERRFRDLSRVVHPDRFSGAGATERRRALSRAVDASEAWRAVRDPVRRAEALLRRAGVEVDERRQPKASQALLMEFMELREQLAEAKAAGDAAQVAGLLAQVKGREAGVLEQLGAGFAGLDAAAPGAEAAARGQALLALLGELRYVRRFVDEAAPPDDL
jgi:molecular chaperone HscB